MHFRNSRILFDSSCFVLVIGMDKRLSSILNSVVLVLNEFANRLSVKIGYNNNYYYFHSPSDYKLVFRRKKKKKNN